MAQECRMTEIAPLFTLSVRRRTAVQSLPQVIGEAYKTIAQYLQSIDQSPSGPPYATYYNMDMQNLDVELGFTVAKKLPENDDIKAGEIALDKAAETLHIGPYSSVEPAYNLLFKYIKDNGYEWTGVAYEFYLNDPEQTPAKNLQTRILLPVKKSK